MEFPKFRKWNSVFITRETGTRIHVLAINLRIPWMLSTPSLDAFAWKLGNFSSSRAYSSSINGNSTKEFRGNTRRFSWWWSWIRFFVDRMKGEGRVCGVFEVENLVANRARQRHMCTCNRSRALNEKVGRPNAQLQLKNAKYFARVDRPVVTPRLRSTLMDSRADRRRREASASFSKLLTGRYRASLQPFHLFIVFVFASGFMGWKVFKKTFHPRCSTLFFSIYLCGMIFFFFFFFSLAHFIFYDTYQIFLSFSSFRIVVLSFRYSENFFFFLFLVDVLEIWKFPRSEK